jgi:hypothetical protein
MQKQDEFIQNKKKAQYEGAKFKEMEEQKEMQLHPKINPSSHSMVRKVDDLYEWNRVKEQKQI